MVKGCENKSDAEKTAGAGMTPPGTARSAATADPTDESPNQTSKGERAATTSA
jgi:hypothetical protein